MTNCEIETKLGELIREERKITNEILELINLADKRNIYLEKGFGSLFKWLVEGFGYSESAANRRIQAAKLLQAVPEVSQKLSTGEVNLSTIAKAQSMIRLQERVSGQRLSQSQKSLVVKKIEHKSAVETESILLEMFPQTASKVHEERKVAVTDSVTRLSLNLSNDTLKDLERVKDLLSHSLPHGSLVDVVEYLAQDFLKRKDPLRKQNSCQRRTENRLITKNSIADDDQEPGAQLKVSKIKTQHPDSNKNLNKIADATKRRVTVRSVSASVKREVFQRSGGKCTFKDLTSGKICSSTFQVQVDHIYPKSLGGEDTLENLRCLCRKHNLLVAEQALGTASTFWRGRS